MKKTGLSQAAGIITALLGLTVITGWYTHLTPLVTLLPGYNNIVFNSALAFLLTGSALLVPGTPAHRQKNIFLAAGIITALLAALTLAQNIFGYSLGIDELFVRNWLIDQNPQPGRMENNNALAFLFSGLTLALLPFAHKKIVSVFTQILIFSILMLGFSALLGNFFDLDLLFTWSPQATLSLQTSLGNALFGLGLWSIWNNNTNDSVLSPENEAKRIISLSATTIFCIALLSGAIILRFFSESHVVPNEILHEEIEPAVLIAMLVGMGMLLWQLAPMIKQLLNSEKKLLAVNERIKESENRFRSAFDQAAIGMALISPEGKFMRVNEALCHILGYASIELLMMHAEQVTHKEDLIANHHLLHDLIIGKVNKYQAVQRYLHKNGEIVWVAVNMSLVKNSYGDPFYLIAQLQNITTEKKAEEQLRHLAYHDALTGLYNRNSLEQKVQELLTASQRHQQGFSVIFLDLDRFKNVNDSIGHDAGDTLLQIVSQRLRNAVRSMDLIARIGGDEFVIVLTELNKVDRITNTVRKIINVLRERIMIRGQEVYITTSIGVSVYPYDGNDVQTLMKNADLALYRAKELGRNNYQFCTPEMTAQARQKMSRQNAIVQAMAKNEFELYFQPKLDLNTQTISGVEALLRWHNSEYSNVNASDIIHLAEETGLIIALNEWVLKTACEQMNVWHQNGFPKLTLAVNLSARQFYQANFAEALMKTLDEHQFPPECLELEITEALIMQDPEYILHILHLLKERGICIAIDDFGTGYSSLDYLRRFAIDKIKIDKKFIQTITTDNASASVVSAMIVMANKLGIKTVAEGVEKREQYEFLLKEKCTEMQGYFLSYPANAESMTKFLRNPMMQSYLMRTVDDDASGE